MISFYNIRMFYVTIIFIIFVVQPEISSFTSLNMKKIYRQREYL